MVSFFTLGCLIRVTTVSGGKEMGTFIVVQLADASDDIDVYEVDVADPIIVNNDDNDK